jgi:nucleoside-diphosphate-sugar epimerase
MKVLITGAAGFVGSHLAKSLLRDGHAVRGFVRPTKDTSALEQLGVEIARGELNEKRGRNQFKEVEQKSMIPVSRKNRHLERESG